MNVSKSVATVKKRPHWSGGNPILDLIDILRAHGDSDLSRSLSAAESNMFSITNLYLITIEVAMLLPMTLPLFRQLGENPSLLSQVKIKIRSLICSAGPTCHLFHVYGI